MCDRPHLVPANYSTTVFHTGATEQIGTIDLCQAEDLDFPIRIEAQGYMKPFKAVLSFRENTRPVRRPESMPAWQLL